MPIARSQFSFRSKLVPKTNPPSKQKLIRKHFRPAGARQTITETVAEGAEEVTIDDFKSRAAVQERVAAVGTRLLPNLDKPPAAQEAFDQAKDELDTLLQEDDLEFISKIEDFYRAVGLIQLMQLVEITETLVDNLVDASRVDVGRKG